MESKNSKEIVVYWNFEKKTHFISNGFCCCSLSKRSFSLSEKKGLYFRIFSKNIATEKYNSDFFWSFLVWAIWVYTYKYIYTYTIALSQTQYSNVKGT